MGANYIPEDQIVTRCNEEKTRKLLADCKAANYNFIRVWGGGYYPDEYFYDYCDENGIIVWQDFMFACSAYLLTEEFEETVRGEVRDNVIRLRNHPSLGLWCGNNEIESAWEYWGLPEDEEAKRDYLIILRILSHRCLKPMTHAKHILLAVITFIRGRLQGRFLKPCRGYALLGRLAQLQAYRSV